MGHLPEKVKKTDGARCLEPRGEVLARDANLGVDILHNS